MKICHRILVTNSVLMKMNITLLVIFVNWIKTPYTIYLREYANLRHYVKHLWNIYKEEI